MVPCGIQSWSLPLLNNASRNSQLHLCYCNIPDRPAMYFFLPSFKLHIILLILHHTGSAHVELVTYLYFLLTSSGLLHEIITFSCRAYLYCNFFNLYDWKYLYCIFGGYFMGCRILASFFLYEDVISLFSGSCCFS